ncbi:hypothetical protein BaRGS_00013538 [Batillaria attramentaria]|uniref:Ig-like domain-containing protein n=1 Tax=Batillaria attramentaria TaxID=370345 RepID=A0ABD0L6M6_9CAEN
MRRNGSLFDPPYAYIATCGASDTRCTSSYPDLFNVTRSGLVSNLTVVSVNRSNYVTGGQFACRTEHESQKSDYATCTIEAGWPSEVESCCATMDPHTKEVKGGCFIRKAWNPANYECNWYEKQGTYPWTQVDHKRLWPNTPEQFFEGGLQYTNFTCLFTRRVPNSVAHYNYRVNILPGDLNLDVPLSPSCWFQFTTHGGWVQKPSNQVAQVGNTATFVCISSNLSPSIVWTQGTKVLFSNGARMSDAVPARYRLDGDFTLLITDVRASDAGEYGCNIQDYGSASANLVVLGDSDGGGAVFTTKPPLVGHNHASQDSTDDPERHWIVSEIALPRKNCLELESSLQKTLKDAGVVNFGGDVLEPATDQQVPYRIRCNVTISFSTRKPTTFMRRRNATKCDVIHWDRSMSSASLYHIPCCRFSDVDIEPYTLSVISGVKLVLLLWTTPTSPTLEPVVKFLSHSKGHIESPGWTKERLLPLDVDSCVTVESPSSNVLLRLIGKEGLECGPDIFALTEGRGCTGKMLWNTCNVMLDSLDPAGDLKLRSGAVSLRFGAVGGVEKGFRILFAFYNDTTAPQQLRTGDWICFVHHWEDKQRFFLCRLESECTGSYTGQSFCRLWECYFHVNLEDDCYSYIRPDVNGTGLGIGSSPANVSWDEALGYCTARNLSLPTPETLDKRLFLDVLLDRLSTTRAPVIYLGLRKAREKMYHKLWKWSTGSIAYTVEVRKPSGARKDDILGGGLKRISRSVYGFIRTQRHPAYVLCERLRPAVPVAKIHQKSPSPDISDVHLTLCPANHTTHTFLACDVHSDCWLDGENCASPMTPLPPSFTCDSQAERVPFSLYFKCDEDAVGLVEYFKCDEDAVGLVEYFKCDEDAVGLVEYFKCDEDACDEDAAGLVEYFKCNEDAIFLVEHFKCDEDAVGLVEYFEDAAGSNGFRTSVPVHEFTSKEKTLQASLVPPTMRLESSSAFPVLKSTTPGPQLEVVFSSPFKGYIQTPGWPERKQILENFNNCLALEAPPRHVVMATVLTIDTNDMFHFRLFEGAGCIGEVILAYSSEIQSLTGLSRSRVMSVRFASYSQFRLRERFKLLFSFHNQSALPQRLPDGKWNCSVPHWGDFQQHFMCTLEPECADGRDDVICPWKDSWITACGKGHLAASKCISFKQMTRPVTWVETHRECVSHQTQLLSPGTIADFTDLFLSVAALDYHYSSSLFLFFGLTFSSERMYADGIVFVVLYVACSGVVGGM